MPDIITGNITCPQCNHKQSHTARANVCQPFYKCNGCQKIIKVKKTCCVFCDYGDRKCPGADSHIK